MTEYDVAIIGAGTAGIMVAAQLKRKNKTLRLGIFDPADKHYYQPAWTLVGADTYDMEKTARPMKDLIPEGVEWIKHAVKEIDEDKNQVRTNDGINYHYKYLVICPGLVMKPELIEGLPESLGKGVVCSNYVDPEHTKSVMMNFKGGNALFTQPTTPIKCGGAPQKAAYLSADYFRKNLKEPYNVIFATPGTVIFGVKEIAATLHKVIQRYGIHFKPYYAPIHIDGKKQIATFKISDKHKNDCVVNENNEIGEEMSGDALIRIPFNMLHLAPPQGAPNFISNSSLANEAGWLDVDIHSLQHKRVSNIFGLGDVAALPTAKTGAAIRKQVPVVVENVLRLMRNDGLGDITYQGYSSCPLVTGYGKMVLAEFDYDGNFTPDPKLKNMLVFNSDKEHWRLWMLKKYMLPYLYWNKMLKGDEI